MNEVADVEPLARVGEIQSHNPATGELIWSGGPGNAAAEVAAARAAFPAWAAQPVTYRMEAVRSFANVVR